MKNKLFKDQEKTMSGIDRINTKKRDRVISTPTFFDQKCFDKNLLSKYYFIELTRVQNNKL